MSTEHQQQKLSGLSIVLPTFNEEEIIGRTLDSVVEYGRQSGAAFEVIVVNDGSTDGTAQVVRERQRRYLEVRLLDHQRNLGYGEALRSGFNAARHDWILLMDSDGQFAVTQLDAFLPYTSQYDLIVGYRARRRDPWTRRILTWGYNSLVRYLLGLSFDFGCGFKLFRRSAWQRVQPVRSRDHKIFSVEWLWQSTRQGMRLKQLPVEHYPRTTGSPTGARLSIIMAMLRDLLKLWLRHRDGPLTRP